jgi:hypothetical protein
MFDKLTPLPLSPFLHYYLFIYLFISSSQTIEAVSYPIIHLFFFFEKFRSIIFEIF